MTFDEKAVLLYEYIVGGVSTTRMADYLYSNYGIQIGQNDFNSVLREYNINYAARGTGANMNGSNFDGGQHKGAYSGGFQAEDGQVYEVDIGVIKDYMNTYKRKKLNLEQYLDLRFNGGGVGGFELPAVFAKLIPAAVAVIAVLIGYNLIFRGHKDAPSRETMTNGSQAPTTSKVYTTVPADKNLGNTAFGSVKNDDGTAYFGIVVTFDGEESDMEGVEDYYLCVGSETSKTKLTVGGICSGDINLPVGKEFDVWVVSGTTKSDVWHVEVGPLGGTVYFDCAVGEDGSPEFKCSDVLGKYLIVSKQ